MYGFFQAGKLQLGTSEPSFMSINRRVSLLLPHCCSTVLWMSCCAWVFLGTPGPNVWVQSPASNLPVQGTAQSTSKKSRLLSTGSTSRILMLNNQYFSSTKILVPSIIIKPYSASPSWVPLTTTLPSGCWIRGTPHRKLILPGSRLPSLLQPANKPIQQLRMCFLDSTGVSINHIYIYSP